jgi:hypothetical protein
MSTRMRACMWEVDKNKINTHLILSSIKMLQHSILSCFLNIKDFPIQDQIPIMSIRYLCNYKEPSPSLGATSCTATQEFP